MNDLAVQWLTVAVDVSLKAVVLAVAAAIILHLLKIHNINLRHRTWTGVLVGMLLLPALAQTLPGLQLPIAIPEHWRITDWSKASKTSVPEIADTKQDPMTDVPRKSTPPFESQEPFLVPHDSTTAARHSGASFPQPDEALHANAADTFVPPEIGGSVAANDADLNREPQKSTSPLNPPLTQALQPPRWPQALFWVWSAGAGLMAIRLLIGVVCSFQLVRSSRRITTDDLDKLGLEHRRLLDGDWKAATYECPFIRVPLAVGVFRPCVLLPAEWTMWSAGKLQAVMTHEKTHIQRGDGAVTFLAELNRCLYWFHPLAWWLRSKLDQLAETACDDAAIDCTGDRATYARHLLEVATVASNYRSRLISVGISMARPSHVETRINAILDLTRPLSKRLTWTSTLLLFVALAPFITLAAVAQLSTDMQAQLSANNSATGDASAAAKAGDSDRSDETGTNRNEALITENQQRSEQSSGGATPQEPGKKTPHDEPQAVPKNIKSDARTNTIDKTSPGRPTLRGNGDNREMLVRGRVFDADGKPSRGFELVATVFKSPGGQDNLPAKVDGNEFTLWVPINGSHWRLLNIVATAQDGRKLAAEAIGNREVRQAAISGVNLRLTPTNRTVKISVTHNGMPVQNAHVNAEHLVNIVLQGKTDANGVLTFHVREGDELRQFTAWTDDFRIGGYSFGRKPRRDPLGTEYTIELDDCHNQIIRFVDADERLPVANVSFNLIVGTGEPNYNFAAVPGTFPHCRMTTDADGAASFRWFPNWKTHGAYIDILDPQWATAVGHDEFETADDGAFVMTLKRRVSRKPFAGKVASDRFDVGGLLVEIKSFQGEEKSHSDHVYAFTDELGNFTADCIPGATYTVCVNDGKLQSEMIDLIPYELDTGKSNIANLNVSEGNLIEIHVTFGTRNEPMQNQSVYVRQTHRYKWLEEGEMRSGHGARDYPVYTDDHGVARARALAGSEMRITVHAGEWRSEEKRVTVQDEGVTLVEFHREVDEERKVKGRLLASPDLNADVTSAEIVFGSIDGNTDEREAITADAEGRFAFKTKAVQLGIFAYTRDGRAAVVAKPENLDEPIEIHLKPTMDLHGQLLGKNDEPLVNHAVRVIPSVSGKRDYNKSFSTSFETKTFTTKTDENGNYTLKDLPTELDLTLRADPIDDSEYDAYLDEFYLVVGDQRPRMVSRLGRTSKPDLRTLSEKYNRLLRDARLGGYHILLLSYDQGAEEFVDAKLLDRDATREVMSFLNLSIQEGSLAENPDRKFAESKGWPQPAQGKVFACALDSTGKELGRIELDTGKADAAAKAAEFIHQFAPPQADAQVKWEAAVAEAKRSGRRVWAQIGQRYCGPCFQLSRWLDDNRVQIERDYVLLKIDDVRDAHGVDVAKRIVGNRKGSGVPFYAIFDANEQLLIDSEGPLGNIGFPSSFEGHRHLTRMLRETRRNLTEADIEQIVETLEN